MYTLINLDHVMYISGQHLCFLINYTIIDNRGSCEWRIKAIYSSKYKTLIMIFAILKTNIQPITLETVYDLMIFVLNFCRKQLKES